VFAEMQAIFFGKMESRSHRDFSSNLNIPLREIRPVMNVILGKLEENPDALKSYLLRRVSTHLP